MLAILQASLLAHLIGSPHAGGCQRASPPSAWRHACSGSVVMAAKAKSGKKVKSSGEAQNAASERSLCPPASS
eukprot:634031-Prymnesium_polylepis.1